MARVGLASSSGLPLDPAIATMIVLYILKIGVNIFCDYTEPPAASGGTLPSAK
jgi:divalent metal cation (Fe/Co/Zn/Cd) transporter